MAVEEQNIIIMGAGEVGKGLARRLIAEGHNITIIDVDQALLSELETQLDVLGIVGNGASAMILQQAGIESASIFIGVSDDDECNLLACGVAKQFGVQATIARVRSEDYIIPDRQYYANALQIDLIINPDEVASQELYDLLDNPIANSVTDFAGGQLKLLGFEIGLNSPICNHTLMEFPELGFSGSLLVASLVREGKVVVPQGDTRILSGDELYVIAAPAALDIVNTMGGGQTSRSLKKVVMVGASRVSHFLAEKFEHSDTHFMIIEQDHARCEQFAAELESTTVLNGDGTDISVLTQAGVGDADGFVSSSQDDETNILSALLAKERGARRVITLMRKPQYIPLLEHIKPIDVAVNPRIATINAIMRYVRKGKILSMATLADEQAEAFEVEILPNSTLVGKRLKENFLPRNVLIGAIVRGEEVIIPRGDYQLDAGDRLIVIALKELVDKVDELFSIGGRPSKVQSLIRSISGKKV